MIEGLGCLLLCIVGASYVARRSGHPLGWLRPILMLLILGAGLRAVGLLSASLDHAWINGDLVKFGRTVMPWASALLLIRFIKPKVMT